MGMVSTFTAVSVFLLITYTEEYHVQLYDGKDFDGFMGDLYPGPDCVSLLESRQNQTSSLITDVCIMVHDNDECDYGRGNSIRIPAGEHPDLAVFHHSNVNFDNRIAAIKVCSSDVWGGGDIRHVEFGGPEVWYGRWEDFCECVTLPEYMFGNVTSVYNYGNCVRLYSREECLGDSVDIHAGVSDDSRHLSFVGFDGQTRSFSVCGDTTLCTRLSAEVIQFELSTTDMGNAREVEMTSKTIFENNGGSPATENYISKKTITQILEVSRIKVVTSMTSVSVSDSVLICTADPDSIEVKTVEALKEAYTFTTNSSTIKPIKFTKKEEIEFSINESIQISPCSQQTIASHVKVLQGYTASYAVHAKIRGQKGRRMMTAQELKNELNGMDYVQDYDENTIIAKANGTILADLPLETIVRRNEISITGCNDKAAGSNIIL